MKIMDIIILALVLFCAVRGGARGFWLTAARLFGILAAAAGAWFLHPALKAWLRNEPGLITGFQKTLLGPFLNHVSPEGTQSVLVRLADVLNQSKLPGFIKKILLTSGDSPNGILVTLNETTLSLLSFIALLVGMILVIQVMSLVLDRFFKLPGLSLLNRGLGTVLGGAEGIFLTGVILAILTPWIAFRPEGFLAKSVAGSPVAGWLYQHNYLLTLIDFTFK